MDMALEGVSLARSGFVLEAPLKENASNEAFSTLVLDFFKAAPSLDFDEAIIGRASTRTLHVENPSSSPITVQIDGVNAEKGLSLDSNHEYAVFTL
jgi:hypothetical protein